MKLLRAFLGCAVAAGGIWTVPRLAAASARATSAPRTFSELRDRLTAHVSQPRFQSALWGVKIVSLETGRTWFEHHADRLLSPASNSKLYTGALALDRLGGDYRIHTPVFATAVPDATGVIRGDLIVSGRGDPSWTTRGASKNFWDAFEPVVAVLVRAGVKRISGDVVADATWFHQLPNGAGWTADDLNEYYGAEVSAITLEQNYAELRLTAGNEVGEPIAVAFVQPCTGLTVESRVVTIAAGGTKQIEAQRVFGDSKIYLFGELPVAAKPEIVDVTVPRPSAWYAEGLKQALARRGIIVEGRSRGVRWPEASTVGVGAFKLGETVSPSLRELVAAFMKPSQNLETDLIFGHVGELTRGPATPPLRSTEELGVAALREFLEKEGLPVDEVRLEEGSGLSRNNLVSANATVALLTAMTKHGAAADFLASLPTAGVEGTLRARMKGTPAEGNVRAKTGTLRFANALSGYLTTATGERLVFSVMLNRQNPPPPGRAVRDDLDDVAIWLAGLRDAP